MMLFRLILREFRAQKMRMALTIGAVVWGTVSITLLLAFGEGLERQMVKSTHGLGDHIVIMGGSQTGKPYEGLPPGRRINLTMEDMYRLRDAFPEIKSITAEYNTWSAALGYGGQDYSKLLSGVTPEFGAMRSHVPQAGGRFLNALDERYKRRVVFLGDKLTETVFGNRDPVGEIVTVDGTPFTVIGAMQKKQQNSNYAGPDDDKISIPAATFQAMFGHRYVRRIIYQLQDGIEAESLEPRIIAFFATKFRYAPDDSRALWFWDVGENERILRMVFLGINGFMFFIGAMTLLISGVGIANIMYVTVRERTREIGTKMALGGERKHIIIGFLTEALTIALVGGVLGILGSIAVIKGIGLLPDEAFADMFGQPRITWLWTLLTVFILTLIGFFSGYFPARRAASVNPVEALRYE
jgi:putative ABC transport system permease protein